MRRALRGDAASPGGGWFLANSFKHGGDSVCRFLLGDDGAKIGEDEGKGSNLDLKLGIGCAAVVAVLWIFELAG